MHLQCRFGWCNCAELEVLECTLTARNFFQFAKCGQCRQHDGHCHCAGASRCHVVMGCIAGLTLLSSACDMKTAACMCARVPGCTAACSTGMHDYPSRERLTLVRNNVCKCCNAANRNTEPHYQNPSSHSSKLCFLLEPPCLAPPCKQHEW
jgi:hypothetical protein